MRAYFWYAGVIEEGKGSGKPGDSGQVQRSRFQPVRQKCRHLLKIALTAGSSRDQRRDHFGGTLAQHQAADSLRAKQPLVAGEGQGIEVHFLHIDVQHPGALSRVRKKQQSVFSAEASDFFERLNIAEDIAGMIDQDRPGFGF